MEHLFAICAYKESPYLTECIRSLQAQSDPSPILLCTATPSPFLEETARQYGLTYRVNADPPDIAGDWNFALRMCQEEGAELATLCHQDDLYLPDYAAAAKAAYRKDPELTIFFSDYGEQRGSEQVYRNRNLKIKRLLLWRLIPYRWQTRKGAKRRSLAFGDPICCPAVSLNLKRIPLPLFTPGLSTNLDWDAWERLSRMPGRFHYDRRYLMLHRIHEASTTSQVLEAHGRTEQDYAIFCRFWPRPIAKLLTRFYSLSEKSNWS